ncbi:protein LKAAEAR1 isoform X3 [Vulpes vulpes]|uniref:Protein LKAAEAR1 isoform X3 n=1 Tax=Vulpes vulpes TaxID=9627 RepID=A0ABM4YM52_VULVU
MTRPSRTLAPPNPDADPALQDDGPAHPGTGPALLAAGSAHAAPPGTAPPRREGGAGLLVARQPRQQAPASRGCVRGWDPRKGSARGPEVSSRLSASSARGQKRNSLKPLDQRLLATAAAGVRARRHPAGAAPAAAAEAHADPRPPGPPGEEARGDHPGGESRGQHLPTLTAPPRGRRPHAPA